MFCEKPRARLEMLATVNMQARTSAGAIAPVLHDALKLLKISFRFDDISKYQNLIFLIF
jgi:hypothetical protein